jgi:ankyrin repeat protein
MLHLILQLQVVQLLYTAGANVHYRSSAGTAMHMAAHSGSTALVKWLQSVGVDTCTCDAEGMLPLHTACHNTQPGLVQYLLSLPNAADDMHRENCFGLTPLHCAAREGADSVMQLLLQRGASVSAADLYGSAPLAYARTTAVVKLLLAAGADAAAVNKLGLSVLHMQADVGAATGIICLLLKAGADPTVVDSEGSTPAHIAGMRGHFALEALLSRAADEHRNKHPIKRSITKTASSCTTDVSADSSVNTSSTANATAATSTSCDAASVRIACSAVDSAAVSALATVTAELSLKCDMPSVVDKQQQQQQQQCNALKAKQPCANCSKPTTKL